MAKNVFAQSKEPVNQPKRNTFDLAFQNNLSMEFGKLYPVFCKEVVPGDSLRIKPTFGLRFMPMTFPVQTRMQANLHFFYVRTRNLWKDFPDFIGDTKKNLVSPYLSKRSLKELAQTRKLGDYMGLPTVLAGSYGIQATIDYNGLLANQVVNQDPCVMPYLINDTYTPATYCNVAKMQNLGFTSFSPGSTIGSGYKVGVYTEQKNDTVPGRFVWFRLNQNSASINIGTYPNMHVIFTTPGTTDNLSNAIPRVAGYCPIQKDEELGEDWYYIDLAGLRQFNYRDAAGVYHNMTTVSLTWEEKYAIIQDQLSGNGWRLFLANEKGYNSSTGYASTLQFPDYCTEPPQDYGIFHGIYQMILDNQVISNYMDIKDVDDAHNFYQSSDTRISALPFRAYESIYNAFYRNQQNDPYMLPTGPGGAYQAEYNKYIPSQDGGEDDNDYALRFRNWEMDYLTSAVPSPQQGVAPLVGVSASGQFTFDNGDGTTTTVTPTIGPDGDTLTGIDSYSTSDGENHDLGALARMKDIILRGISISDFRNVNALQRWLETNMRRGFRYKDQIMSHYGVDAKFDELDMPEFIGGMSEPVQINQINQTIDQTAEGFGPFGKVLGSFAGQASILASSNHDVERYCDEHGFIIGIMSISPVPNYSQLLPKMFLKHDNLDYYFPEFGHIGLQPITYREVCPLQSFAHNNTDAKLNDVFGYQRAWYDLLGSVDEVHGLMRTELRNFLINRQFDLRPQLGRDFIQIHPDDVNDVFTVTDSTDKIIGQLYFEVSAKRPIPRFGIPRLEA